VNTSNGSSASPRSQGRYDSICRRHSVHLETASDRSEGLMVGLSDLHTADRAVVDIQFHVHQLIRGGTAIPMSAVSLDRRSILAISRSS